MVAEPNPVIVAGGEAVHAGAAPTIRDIAEHQYTAPGGITPILGAIKSTTASLTGAKVEYLIWSDGWENRQGLTSYCRKRPPGERCVAEITAAAPPPALRPPPGMPATATSSAPAASITARRSSTRSSSVGTPATRSDKP